LATLIFNHSFVCRPGIYTLSKMNWVFKWGSFVWYYCKRYSFVRSAITSRALDNKGLMLSLIRSCRFLLRSRQKLSNCLMANGSFVSNG
jgi:hypothetical protein